MSLKVELTVEKTTLLCQENPVCHLSAANTGDATMKVAALGASPEVPILHVIELKTGVETFHHGHRHGPDIGIPYQEIAADKKLEYDFDLNSVVKLTLPTEYEVSAILYYDSGAKRAETKPVKLKIIPVTPRSLSLVNVQGGWAAVVYGVCVNAASDPPQIVRHRFDIMTEGGVGDARPVANANLRADPAISSPPNSSVAHSHWIAWRDEGSLAFTHFDSEIGSLPTGVWKCPQPEWEIVHPLATQPVTDPAQRPVGAALLWVGDPARRMSAFQVVNFTPDGKAVAGAPWDAGGPKPSWMKSHITSSGQRLFAFIRDTDQGCTFFLQPWSQTGPSGEPRSLAKWNGTCLGGGTVMINDDSIRGATLVRGPQAGGAKLELIVWKIGPKGEYGERARHTIPWAFQHAVNRALVRIGPGGKAVALIAGGDGQWQFFDDETGFQPLPATVAGARQPVEVVFMDESVPVFIVGQVGQGFQVILANGDPLPGHSG